MIKNGVYVLFCSCMNIIFNLLLVHDVHTTTTIKFIRTIFCHILLLYRIAFHCTVWMCRPAAHQDCWVICAVEIFLLTYLCTNATGTKQLTVVVFSVGECSVRTVWHEDQIWWSSVCKVRRRANYVNFSV